MMRALAVLAWITCGWAHACGNPGDTVATGARYAVAFKTTPSPIPAGRHFTVDFTVCPLGGAALPANVRVDASMPEHRHGMNYRPTVVARGGGHYHAEGFLFHMSGRWELAFDVVSGNTTERVTSAVVLQ